VKLPCCSYHAATAIKWNQFNGVVQCHNCGESYAPQPQPDDTAGKMIAAGNRMAAMLDTSLTAPIEQWPDESEIDAALKEWRFAVDPCPLAAAGKGIDEPHPQQSEEAEALAALGWQAIECSVCGSSARAFPQPQREWVGLTDEAVSLEAHNRDDGDWNDLRYRDCWFIGFLEGAKWAEAKLREKNAPESKVN
jgi:hypothetical protein